MKKPPEGDSLLPATETTGEELNLILTQRGDQANNLLGYAIVRIFTY